MKAVVFHDVGDIRLEDVPEPRIKDSQDAIVATTVSAICGTDLHMVRGTMPGMKRGTILGHEAVGIVEKLGKGVRNFSEGDRVVVASTIACGYCNYCRAGYYAQCNNANPNGARAGTAFFGGPKDTGSFDGLQAERSRIPFANVGMVRIPDGVTDDQALLVSDIFPTGYFGADLAEIEDGDTVAVFGCGPVGLFAIASAFLMNAGRVLAVDRVPSRLEMARSLGAEVINFEEEDPVEVILELTGGIGVDRAIDAVGVDAVHAHHGPAEKEARKKEEQHQTEIEQVAPRTPPEDSPWHPGDAPSQAVEWEVDALAKAGTLSIIGVYPPPARFFPFGKAMNKNLTINAGNCNHRRYIPHCLDLIQNGTIDPTRLLTNVQPLTDAVDAYRHFDAQHDGWVKVALMPPTPA